MSSIRNRFIQILGWATIGLLLFGVIYELFIYEEPEPERLSPAEFRRLEKIYDDEQPEQDYPSDLYRLAP